MREPPDPLRHSLYMNLDQTPDEAAKLKHLEQRRKDAEQRACLATGSEQIETATREQDEAAEAINHFWRTLAARQVDGADQELRDWLDWTMAGNSLQIVSVDLGSVGDIADDSDDQAGEEWKRRR